MSTSNQNLIAAIKELTLVVKGLTGVLIEDREAEGQDEEAQDVAAQTYMDGSPRA